MSETEAVQRIAEIIGVSIRTAPKSAGADDIVYKIFTSREKAQVAAQMLKIGKELGAGKSAEIKNATDTAWASDARTVRMSDCLILIGVRGRKPLGFNCGMCGWESCKSFLEAALAKGSATKGPFCAFKLWDLGIAIDSAANQAKNFNVDNRIMYTAGVAGGRLNLLEGCSPILGLPLYAGGKNIYFDRREKIEAMEILRGKKNG